MSRKRRHRSTKHYSAIHVTVCISTWSWLQAELSTEFSEIYFRWKGYFVFTFSGCKWHKIYRSSCRFLFLDGSFDTGSCAYLRDDWYHTCSAFIPKNPSTYSGYKVTNDRFLAGYLKQQDHDYHRLQSCNGGYISGA